MKKIIAVLLSINLLILNTTPAWAQLTAGQKLYTALRKASTDIPGAALAKVPLPQGTPVYIPPDVSARIAQATLQNMRVPAAQNDIPLLTDSNPLLPPARRILAIPNATERAFWLRSRFVTLALEGKASPKDQEEAVNFYRGNLQKFSPKRDIAQTVADVASLGLLGSKKDGALILKVARQAQGTPAEAGITSAAARALLRVGDYDALETLAQTSTVQPQLWDGITAYAQIYHLPVSLQALERTPLAVGTLQTALSPLGPLNLLVVDPSLEATHLYMNAGKKNAPKETISQKTVPAATPVRPLEMAPAQQLAVSVAPATTGPRNCGNPGGRKFDCGPTQTAALAMADKAAADLTQTKADVLAQTKEWLKKLAPKGLTADDGTKFTQRAALYLTAFSIGLEIGTPIMASIKTALNLPLSLAVLITAATYAPYLFGSFIANWLKGKVGRKGIVNTGLALMGGSFALGATALGLDGSFEAWDNQLAQFFSILGSLTAAGTGAVFIHNAVGPIMTEISKKSGDLIRQKRGTYVELSRSIGMMASFAFPFIATSMLGMDWSAPFLLALPVVGASALTLNLAKLPNTKPHVLPAPKMPQAPVMDGVRKARKLMNWKDSIFNNSYVRLLREEPGVGSFITGLFIMNAVEMGINSGFLFMLPQLTKNESDQYLLGMMQFAVPFLIGRYLAGHFLKWFPNRNISVATALSGVSALAALGVADNVYALTAALFTAELGISTAFTLAFARTAKNHLTQDRVTSLIMATAVSCAVGPIILTQIAQSLMDAGLLNEAGATLAAMIGLPSLLALFSAKLFRRMENKTIPALVNGKNLWQKVKNYFTKK